MIATIASGREVFNPTAIILALSKVEYHGGDEMTKVLWLSTYTDILDSNGENKPTRPAIICSELCREGLTSLIDEKMGENPKIPFYF